MEAVHAEIYIKHVKPLSLFGAVYSNNSRTADMCNSNKHKNKYAIDFHNCKKKQFVTHYITFYNCFYTSLDI